MKKTSIWTLIILLPVLAALTGPTFVRLSGAAAAV